MPPGTSNYSHEYAALRAPTISETSMLRQDYAATHSVFCPNDIADRALVDRHKSHGGRIDW